MTDAELQALTALVNADTQSERYDLERYGEHQTKPDLRARQALDAEMVRRGLLEPWKP